MKRLKDPMVTPTAQYGGTTQGNDYAMTAPGSPNILPVQAFNSPMDMQSTDGPAGHPPVSKTGDRIGGNPSWPVQTPGAGWSTPSASAGGGDVTVQPSRPVAGAVPSGDPIDATSSAVPMQGGGGRAVAPTTGAGYPQASDTAPEKGTETPFDGGGWAYTDSRPDAGIWRNV